MYADTAPGAHLRAPTAHAVCAHVDAGERRPVMVVSLRCEFDRELAKSEREERQEILDLLRPALAAAVRERLRQRTRTRDTTARLLDSLDEPAATCSVDGHLSYKNAAFTQLVDVDAEAVRIRKQVTDVARAAGSSGVDLPATRAIHTDRGRYQLHARRLTLHGHREMVLVVAHRESATDITCALDVLRQQFSLTCREGDVVALLMGGRSNADIARMLGISQATARHHTEHVLDKLGIRSRAAVPFIVLARGLSPTA